MLMIHLIQASVVVGVISGLAALYFGNWRHCTLKYAGVSLSTGLAIWILFFGIINPDVWTCNYTNTACTEALLYTLVRNIILIIFHITSGVDALRIRLINRRIQVPNKRKVA
jgi:hypothetical protein